MILPGCTTYSSAARYGQDVYLTGYTSFLIFGSSWARRCFHDSESKLICVDLETQEVSDLETYPASEAGCKPSRACTYLGKCTFDSYSCVASSQDDCSRSVLCKRLGRCLKEGGKCVRGRPSPASRPANSLEPLPSGS